MKFTVFGIQSKISRLVKKQENMTCNDKENRLHTEVRIAEKYIKIGFFVF